MFRILNFAVMYSSYFYLMYFIVGVFVMFLLVRYVFKWGNKKQPYKIRHTTALPGKSYTLVYTDQKNVSKKDNVTYSTLLYSEKYDIQGKPDYIYKKGDDYLPVELKSGKIGEGTDPREKDLMQLVMYFLIIEDIYGVTPKSGRLIYSDAMFIVSNTKKLRKRLKYILKEMREMLKTGEQEAKVSFTNCRHCICRGTVCEYSE